MTDSTGKDFPQPSLRESGRIPENVQQRFIKKIEDDFMPNERKKGAKKYKIWPENLLFVHDWGKARGARRLYFANVGDLQSQSPFHVYAEASFQELSNKLIPEGLHKSGDDRKQSISIYFPEWYNGKEEGVNIEFSLGGIPVRIDFNVPNSKFPAIKHLVRDEKWKIDKWVALKDYTDHVETNYGETGGGEIHLEYNKDIERIILTSISKKFGREVKESVKIPLGVDREKVIETLFPRKEGLLEDPFNAEPSQDSSWLNADFLRVVGIVPEVPEKFRRT